jgi:hypothetical protein
MSRHGIVEEHVSIDVNELNQRGAFNGSASDWLMEFPFLGLRTSRFVIEYRGRHWLKDQPSQRISVRWTRCHFGSHRPWLECLCGRRVGKLYDSGFGFGCRQCLNLIMSASTEARKFAVICALSN